MNSDINTVFDEEFGLNQLSGNRDLLLKMLDRFAADYASFDEEITQLVNAGQLADAKSKAHAIKGVSGNLGFWQLHHASKMLEEALKNESPIEKDTLNQFTVAMTAALEKVQQVKAGPSASNEQPSAVSDGTALQDLITLLENFEFIDSDRLAELLDAAGIDSGKRPDIEQAINDLDYPTAMELLNS